MGNKILFGFVTVVCYSSCIEFLPQRIYFSPTAFCFDCLDTRSHLQSTGLILICLFCYNAYPVELYVSWYVVKQRFT